ncbi:hypothetical protein Hamer_G001093 [Homarus americanus]|uniref:Uncharacterized protein n=1 Tax=Homarus americanus TaxID=6706 RepID=A0A8J5T324_HOMAM|nr:hypothetical protein Hamer_G001093 [Homarus americanus]
MSLQAQEARREDGEKLLKRQEEEEDTQEQEVERLQQLIHTTRRTTAATTAKVATYSTYKEYVERSVATFGKETATVTGVCGRFRDLLTLRLELLLRVNHAFHQLHQARRQLLVFVQSEKEREGQALLQLYRERSTGWTSSRSLGEMEARLAALQTASTHTHTHLTRVRLALVNIYSVARAYQRSLPPLGPRAATSTVLKRLHNFLLDAITVTNAARTAVQPASLRPSAPSHIKPNRRETTPGKPPAQRDSAKKDTPTSKHTGRGSAKEDKAAEGGKSGQDSVGHKGKTGAVGKLTRLESKKALQKDNKTNTSVGSVVPPDSDKTHLNNQEKSDD